MQASQFKTLCEKLYETVQSSKTFNLSMSQNLSYVLKWKDSKSILKEINNS